MLNALLFASLTISGAAGINPDSTANKNVSLDEIVVTDFKQNKRNLTSTAVSTISTQQLQNQHMRRHPTWSPRYKAEELCLW